MTPDAPRMWGEVHKGELQCLWGVGSCHVAGCRIWHIMNGVKVRSGILVLQVASMPEITESMSIGGYSFIHKEKGDRTPCAAGIWADMAKRRNVKATDM